MLRSEDFSAAVRSGARSGSRRLVVHYCAGPNPGLNQRLDSRTAAEATGSAGWLADTPTRVGIVVSKKQVPRATHRNRIKRRLRALMRARLGDLEPGARIVVRPLAAADGATSGELAADLDRLLKRSRELAHSGRRR